MRFQCPFCSYITENEISQLGQKVSCPSCKQSIMIPSDNRQQGCVIGDFILREKLGAGSLATVFKSTQISLGREVALKVLSNEYTDFKGVSDFLKEARAAAKLNHPNLVQAYAVGEDNGSCYLAMDYVKGQTLKDIIQSDEEIPIDKALHIIQQIAEALYYAWEEAEMIHRDVKPDNIMINLEGMAKLTDLGLAMNKSDWHEDMDISGSPSYMSPEQFAGESLDTRSDIYSLGVTLYQILTRKLPFDGSTIRTIAKQHFQEEAVAVNKINSDIPATAATIVKIMIAKSPDDRFCDMEELLKAIWQIRQKTAPSTELIPNVHTISIKRLEYDIQNEKVQQRRREVEKERQVEAKIKDENKSIRTLFIIAVAVLVLLGAFISYDLLTTGQQQKTDEEFSQKISNFENMVRKSSISADDYSELKDIAKELKYKAKMINSPNEEEFNARIQLTLSSAEKKMLNQQIEKMSSDNQAAKINKKKTVSPSKTAIKTAIKKFEQLKTQKAKEVNKLESKVTDLTSKTQALQTAKNQQQQTLQRLKNELTNKWKDGLRIKIYSQLKSAKFDVAKGYLLIEEQGLNKGAEKVKLEWLKTFALWIDEQENNYNILTDNGHKSLKKVSPAKHSPTYLLLSGKPLAAAVSDSSNKELTALARAFLKNKLVTIQAYSYADETKDKAKIAADELESELSKTKQFGDIKKSLTKLQLELDN